MGKTDVNPKEPKFWQLGYLTEAQAQHNFIPELAFYYFENAPEDYVNYKSRDEAFDAAVVDCMKLGDLDFYNEPTITEFHGDGPIDGIDYEEIKEIAESMGLV